MKTIDEQLVLFAIADTVWDQSQKCYSRRKERPIRHPALGDIFQVTDLIRNFRRRWAVAKKDQINTGEKPDFQSIKSNFFDAQMKIKGWTMETRNLYSSAVAKYISLDRSEKSVALDHDRIQKLRFLNYVLGL